MFYNVGYTKSKKEGCETVYILKTENEELAKKKYNEIKSNLKRGYKMIYQLSTF